MNVVQKQGGRRMSVVVTMVLLALYYAAVYRPLAQRERDQEAPFLEVQEQLNSVATNRPAGGDLAALDQQEQALRDALKNLTEARAFLAARHQPDPAIATNLFRPFQLIDYQNERLNRGDRLIARAAERKVKLLPAVSVGLPEYTIENPRPELLWGQLSLVDGVLHAAVEAGVASIESVRMEPPVAHPPGVAGREQFIELPLRIEVTGGFSELARLLAIVLNDPGARASLQIPVIDGLPAASLHRILAVKETTEVPGRLRMVAELSGFLRLPVASGREMTGDN